MIASSTTSPMAITSPAITMVLSVAPAAVRTSVAAISDSGIAVRLISAVRQSKRNETQDDHHQDAADDHRLAEVLQRPLDEAGGPEDGRVDVHALEPRHQGLEGLLDLLGDLQRVAGRLLLDDQQQALAVVDHGVADRRREADLDLGHVAQSQGRPRCGRRR